jgi:triosephosphate isomerase
MKKYMIANWKMHGSQEKIKKYLSEIEYKSQNTEVIICLPAPYIAVATAHVQSVAIGGQDCSAHAEEGAFTGEVRAEMLRDCGARYVIVGHSERRTHHHETDELVAQKAAAAHQAGLNAILCVGETLAQRQAGDTLSVLERQLSLSLPKAANAYNTIIAYEPVWAIGTGKAATLKDVEEVHQVIKEKYPGYSVVYGGSVNLQNAHELLNLENVDGFLVGKASLDIEIFNSIISYL